MNMENYTYNIIWADDEVMRFIKDSQYQQMFKRFNINVLRGCPNGKSFKVAIQELWNYRIDAVITDANFPHEEFDSDKERDVDGLRTVLEVMSSYHTLPVYLYTGRKNIKEIARPRDLENFDEIYYKNVGDDEKNLKDLLERLCEDVKARKTTAFCVDNNFSAEIRYAKMLDSIIPTVNAEKFIRTNLIRSFDNRWDFESERPQEMLNTARKIVEAMFYVGKEWGILPPIEELNEMSKFLQGKNDDYKHTKRIMPKPLARPLWYYLDITQDGSHLKGDLKLGVDAYVTTVQNANILRSVLHIAIDLIRWFVDFALECKTETGVKKLWYETSKSE